MDDLKRKTAAGFLWQSSTAVARAVLQLLVIAVLARQLSPEDFGLFALAAVVLSFVEIFTRYSGVTQAVIQTEELRNEEVSAAQALALGVGLLVSLALYSAADFLGRLLGNPGLADILQMLSVVPFLSSVGTISLGLAYRKMNVRVAALVNLLAYGVGFAGVGIYLAFQGFGVLALVGATVVEAALRSTAIICLVPGHRFAKFSWRDMSGIARFGAGAMLAQFVNACAMNVDRLVVHFSLGTAVLGFYQVALQAVNLPNRFIGDALQRVMFASFSRARIDRAIVRSFFASISEITYFVYLPFCAMLFLFAEDIVLLFLGEGWEKTGEVVRVLALALPLHSVNSISSAAIRAEGAVFIASALRFLVLVYLVVACTLAAPHGLLPLTSAVALGALVYLAASSAVLHIFGISTLVSSLKRFVIAYIAVAALVALAALCRNMFDSFALGRIGVILAVGMTIAGLCFLPVAVFHRHLPHLEFIRVLGKPSYISNNEGNRN